MKKLIALILFFASTASANVALPAEYNYVRAVSTGSIGGYDIDNPYRVDRSSNQIHLAVEVETVIPAKTFVLRCNGANAKFVFDATLSGAEQTTLTNAVNDHKNNL